MKPRKLSNNCGVYIRLSCLLRRSFRIKISVTLKKSPLRNNLYFSAGYKTATQNAFPLLLKKFKFSQAFELQREFPKVLRPSFFAFGSLLAQPPRKRSWPIVVMVPCRPG